MMTELASAGQLRASFLRWALVTVPAIILLGLLGSQLADSGESNPWFASLTKPGLYPPAQVFGIVWPALYLLMGVSLALVLSARGAWWRGRAAVAFIVQFLLNLAWSPVFFALHQITSALVLIVVLDVAVLVTVWLFLKVRPLAAWLLLPYLVWILFATVLTWQFLVANPQADGREAAPATQRIAI